MLHFIKVSNLKSCMWSFFLPAPGKDEYLCVFMGTVTLDVYMS